MKEGKKGQTKLQTNIDARLHHYLKAACFLHGKDMNEVLTELITRWLETDGGESFLSDRSKNRP